MAIKHWAICLLLPLLISSSVVSGAGLPVAEALAKDADNSLWSQMIASLDLRASETSTYATFLAPTDRAVMAFLDEMGLTFDQLLTRPVLVDIVVSYHILPGVSVTDWYKTTTAAGGKGLSSDPKNPTVFATGDANDVISAYRSPLNNLVTLVDAQGFRAVVVGGGTKYGKIIFYDISAVLMGSGYFYTARAAIQYHPQWESAAALYSKAAMYSDAINNALTGHSENTFLMPDQKALKPVAEALVNAPAADLTKVIEYHVLPGLRSVPNGFKNGGSVETLLSGNKLTSWLNTIKTTEAYTGSTLDEPDLTFVANSGVKAHVNLFNIFAGKSLILGLDGVLLPKDMQFTQQASNGRKLLQRHRSTRSGSRANHWMARQSQSALLASSMNTPRGLASDRPRNDAQFSNCVNCYRWGWEW